MTSKTAFPSTQYANGVSPTGHSEGMTLRDYFAAKAMAAMYVASFEWEPTGEARELYHMAIMEEMAMDAYGIADAMLKAREK